MKTILLLLTLILSVNLSAQADTLGAEWTKYYPKNSGTTIDDGYVPYLVGSFKMPEYALETRVCPAEQTITLPNGRKIAGLSCIFFDKSEYVGGNLIFGDDTTFITDITVIPVDEGAKFTVSGEEFDMSFTLRTGMILRYENDYATFNTENRGVWTIRKKV